MPKKTKEKLKRYPELMGLKGAIRANGTNYIEVAKMIGISTHTLSDKVNGHACFTTMEVEHIADYLCMDTGEVLEVFFPRLTKKSLRTKHGKCNDTN